jgi:hypothetical protein
MSLILDHISGVGDDNRLENLQIVCPNCAATLDTHCGRKNAIYEIPRRCVHCDAEFVPKDVRHRYWVRCYEADARRRGEGGEQAAAA